MKEKILENLNQQQVLAIKKVHGPIMAVAGAGSGKTRVLTRRIAYLIEDEGIFPGNILAITFTNKAAEEMRNRVFNLIEMPVEGAWISTFHAMGAKILRSEIHHLGYKSDYQIIDDEDSVIIVKNLMKEHNYDRKNFSPKITANLFASIKGQHTSFNNLGEPIRSMVMQLYPLYNSYLKNNNLVDFQDLLVLVLDLFRNYPKVLKKYQDKFEYILVDEFQDTNDLQYEIVKLLSEKHRNLFIVGDEDQSIYAFRGSNIENIKKFIKDFPEHLTIMLNQNYRSKDTILKAANSVIKNNRNRIKKELYSTLGTGEKIIHFKAGTDEEEAYYVYEKIKNFWKNGVKLNDIAILYRNNAMSRRFEDIFLKYNVPHRVIGNISFYKRKEIKDVIAYLHLIINMGDDYSFSRIYNTPKRGVGNATFAKLVDEAKENNLKLIDVIDEQSEILKGKTKESLLNLKNTIVSLKEKINQQSLLDTYDELIEKTGYKAMLENDDSTLDKSFQSERRLDNLNEFKSLMMEKISGYDINFSNYEILVNLLNDLALHEQAQEIDDAGEYVSLMTVHAAKGLEFKVVFVTCLEQTLFPSSQSLHESFNVDEERRLFYVALTRAKDYVFLTNCRTRFMYGRYMENLDSQFIEEIEEDYIERKGVYQPKKEIFDKPLQRKAIQFDESKYTYHEVERNVSVGNKIEHKTFGKGVVVAIEDDKIRVAFPNPIGIKILIKDHPSYEVVKK
ncbi:MAG: 3'-5' exonuclease [Candidatus Izemoplasmatales bacterium]|nr:3'-5' exonuclease [Candidatus Izemoplasmatales bacterium]